MQCSLCKGKSIHSATLSRWEWADFIPSPQGRRCPGGADEGDCGLNCEQAKKDPREIEHITRG